MEEIGGPIIGLMIIMYILGAFIAWDFNPTHWLIFATTGGRVVSIVVFLAVLFPILDSY